jgi:D-alanine-D-alanine ligase
MSKIVVGVVRGGPSSEYEVSLKTGGNVLRHLGQEPVSQFYQPVDIIISKEGAWHRDGVERSPSRTLAGVDVVFNAMHGQFGEDGQAQKILDGLGVPYTGSDAFASAVGMNKILAKETFSKAGIKTPYYTVVRRGDDLRERYDYVFHHFLLPFVVKPASAGSSVGVTIVKSYIDFFAAVEKALAHGDTVLVEEYIRGREATAAVIDNFRGKSFYALPPIEIVSPSSSDFFDYQAKYSDGTTAASEVCPGNFSPFEKRDLEELAIAAHKALGARHYSRTDFIVSPRRGIYVLEINTLPGLTDASLVPKALAAVGASLGDFFHHIISLARGKK